MSEELSYDELRYNEVSMKASHNSYNRKENIIEQITWYPGENDSNCGCRSLEFDIRQSSEGMQWSVEHLAIMYKKNDPQLSHYLKELNDWADKNPEHDVITIYLDLKKTTDKDRFPLQLDSYITDCISADRIYRPGNIINGDFSLAKSVRQNGGMPLLKDLKGKFIFCLTGNEEDKQRYLKENPKKRFCFVEQDVSDKDDRIPFSEDHIFFSCHVFTRKEEHWAKALREDAQRPNVIMRAYVLDDKDIWNCALQNGCNLLATNEICDHNWAKVGDAPFIKRKTL